MIANEIPMVNVKSLKLFSASSESLVLSCLQARANKTGEIINRIVGCSYLLFIFVIPNMNRHIEDITANHDI